MPHHLAVGKGVNGEMVGSLGPCTFDFFTAWDFGRMISTAVFCCKTCAVKSDLCTDVLDSTTSTYLPHSALPVHPREWGKDFPSTEPSHPRETKKTHPISRQLWRQKSSWTPLMHCLEMWKANVKYTYSAPYRQVWLPRRRKMQARVPRWLPRWFMVIQHVSREKSTTRMLQEGFWDA